MNWNTRITETFGIQYPIIQGGLAHLAYSDLASAVSNAGGLGQITAMSLTSPEALKEEIRKTREKTDRPFGVNFAIGSHGRPYEHMLNAALEEDVKIISVTGGNPVPFFERLQGKNVKTLVLVSEVRHAQKAESLGADAVMVVGHEGGGHLGRQDVSTLVLIPQVVDAVDIPVVASGGIGDGRGWMAAHALGAEGIEMGTRFIATKECVAASEAYVQKIIQSESADTIVVKRSIGAPARALRNEWTEKIIEIEQTNPTYEALKTYISGKANQRFIHDGIEREGYGWAGQVVGLIRDVPSVEELFHRMKKEAEQIRKQWC